MMQGLYRWQIYTGNYDSLIKLVKFKFDLVGSQVPKLISYNCMPIIISSAKIPF